MNTNRVIWTLAVLFTLPMPPIRAQQTTAFTWQGRVTNNGTPANGHYDLRFQLYADVSGTTQVGSAICLDDQNISNGLVTAELDFGTTAFTGHARWLEIAIRPDTGLDCTVSTGFTILSPRRRIEPAPYALNADRLDNYDSSTFLLKPVYDSDGDLKIDAAAVEPPPISSLTASDGTPAVALMADDEGRIGIGTTEPMTALHVYGAVRTESSGVQFGNPPMGGVGMSTHGGNLALILADSTVAASHTGPNAQYFMPTTDDRWQSFSPNLGMEVNAIEILMTDTWGASAKGTLFLRQGIGIDGDVLATSTRTLEYANATFDWQRVPIEPPVSLVPGQMYTIQLVGDGIGTTSWILTLGNAYPGGFADSDPAHDHVFKLIKLGDPNELVSVTPFGYMGVGTTNPASNLAVAGSASVGTDYSQSEAPIDGMLVEGKVGVGTATPQGMLDVHGSMNVGAGFAGSTIPPVNGMLVQGKIGVGTANPQGALDVAGAVTIGAGFMGFVIPPANGLAVQGRVGIGTGTPQSELDVEGSASIGSTYAGSVTPPANGLLVQNKVGIGTITPLNKLDVTGGVAIGSGYGGQFVTPANGLLVQGPTSIGTTNSIGTLTVNSDLAAIPLFLDGNHTDGTSLHIRSLNSGGTDWSLVSTGTTSPNGSGDLSFNTGVNSRFILAKSGRNGFGRYPLANRLEVEGQASKTTAGGFIANSDARIKTDIQPVTKAVDTLMKIRPVTFRYTEEYRKHHPSIADRPYHNIIAQEYAGVFPDYVQPSGEKVPGTDEEILQADTHALTIVSVAAIQELQHEVLRLNEENQALRGELVEGRERFDTLEQRLIELGLDLDPSQKTASSR